ncbi:hypothetical protein C1H46_036782 [Malus baccata]|uniref:Uncharacterized protein n=1 Tax=Malus baccata TaxID=106549 RepID=A0A540KTX9_MALBA|nr:hypothetical protein C1H46_036782 [Malus baccata]
MSDLLESSRVSSQKQNRETWSGPKAENIVLQWSQVWDVVEPRSGCDNLVSEPLCRVVRVTMRTSGLKKRVDCNIPHRPTEKG